MSMFIGIIIGIIISMLFLGFLVLGIVWDRWIIKGYIDDALKENSDTTLSDFSKTIDWVIG